MQELTFTQIPRQRKRSNAFHLENPEDDILSVTMLQNDPLDEEYCISDFNVAFKKKLSQSDYKVEEPNDIGSEYYSTLFVPQKENIIL